MDLSLKHYGTFELDANLVPRFVPDDKNFFRLNAEGLIGKRVEIDMRETRRSNQANRYYYVGVVKVFMDYFNTNSTFSRVVDIEWTHELLAAKMLGFTRQVLPFGEIIEMRNPTRTLTRGEFTQYIENCKSWGMDMFGLTFPELETENTRR